MASAVKKANTVKKELAKDNNIMSCICCGNSRDNYYKSFNPLYKHIEQLVICKDCMETEYQKYLSKYSNDSKLALYYSCRKFDIYFSLSAYEGAIRNSATTGWTIIQSYFKQINSFRDKNNVSRNGYGTSFDESSEFLDRVVVNEQPIEKDKPKKDSKNKGKLENPIWSDSDKQNKNDVIRLIKYDPFSDESNEIKGFLYNKLIDFLDENTLNDSFKLPIVIEMVKGFGQAERLNRALSQIDIVSDSTKISDIKALSDTKQKILMAILAMAKDNGISENYSNNKSKGAGTLSGMIKELQEKGVHNAEVNLYDIETCNGIKQVADISNRSILEQLMLNENDYVDIIKDQKSLIGELDEKSCKFEEENRKLNIKIREMEKFIKEKHLIQQDGD